MVILDQRQGVPLSHGGVGTLWVLHAPNGLAWGQLGVKEHQHALWVGLNPLKVCWGRSRTPLGCSLHERRQPGALSWAESGKEPPEVRGAMKFGGRGIEISLKFH